MNPSRAKTIALYVLVIGLAAVMGLSAVGRMQLAGVGIIGLMAIALCVAYPELGVTSLIVSAFSVEWLIAYDILPSPAQVLQDLLALSIIALIVIRWRRLGRLPDSVASSSPWAKWLLLFVVSGLIGAAQSSIDPLAMIYGLRAIATFVALALVPRGFPLDEPQRRKLARLLIALGLIQVPVAILQFVFLKKGGSGDVVGGTLGLFSSGVLTVMMISLATVFIGMLVHRHGTKLRTGTALVMCMIPPALNETKVFFAVAPAIFAAILLPRARKNLAGAFIVLVLVASSLALVAQSYWALYGNSALGGQDIVGVLVTQQTGSGTAEGGVMKRLPSILFAAREVSRQPGTMLFGFGVGSLARGDYSGTEGLLVAKWGPMLRNTVWVTRVILEYGFVGLLAFIGLLASVFRAGRRLEITSTDSFWRSFGVGVQGIVVTLAIMSVYTGTFTTDGLACMFWLCVGLVSVAPMVQKADAQQ